MDNGIEKLAEALTDEHYGKEGYITADEISAALSAAGLEVRQCASCQLCKHWDIANAHVAIDRLESVYTWDADGDPLYRPPHADLNWSRCAAAPEGFEIHTTEEADALFSRTMAVFDGSSYAAELLTRFDHSCSQFSPRTAATLTGDG